MHLTYLLPAPMHATALGETEMRRRAALLSDWAGSDTRITVTAVDRGPASVESAYEEYLAIPAMGEALRDAERAGTDATVLGCFGDPGLDGLRELAGRPVVGPAGAAMALACTLGHSFSVVTVSSGVRPLLRRLAWETGVLPALCEVRSVELSVLAINQDHDAAYAALRAECEQALSTTDADTLVLGCMSMGFLGAAEQLTAELGVPVLNPIRAAVHHAQTLHRMGLTPSRRAFPAPPALVADADAELMHHAQNRLEVTG
ncbi:aspartate/glutamate racemase family protein [Prauserella cavernicola]|uniref:Aspartate/glutamate racemase family protein n=1 Tax=Prauserella cavernicola TaxID=2800127 RepID=A0A934R218_9PSEU|nr:aspartate/glutamate racemase family protein [Prauserella cavernicola]MBK1789434.1 aspartate/glutamate racemase family protein [Prauserella cavernicola]